MNGITLPPLVNEVVELFSAGFTRPSFRRFVHILLAAILTAGSRTVCNVIRTLDAITLGHPSSYHRLFSMRRWLSWKLSYALCGMILNTFHRDSKTIQLVGDDTVDGHKGKNVYGKSCHRDAVRSTHIYTAYRWGHKWVVLSILVKLPFSSRPWALPCIVALYRTPKVNQKMGLRHKTPAELMRGLLARIIHWFPDKKFVIAVDGGFNSHDLAAFAHRYREHLTLVSRFHPEANLYDPPPERQLMGKRSGRPRVRGRKRASPVDVVRRTRLRKRLTVNWYGGGTRKVEVISRAAHWYKGGQGLVPIRWIHVRDLSGTHRDEYFFSTDPAMTPKQLIGTYTGRWSIETTFQEMRSYVGLESTRGWSRNTVMRMAPSLFGLYSVILLLYEKIPGRSRWKGKMAIRWPGKVDLTFSDVITAVRRWLWMEWVFAALGNVVPLQKLPRQFHDTLLYALAPAA